MSSYTEGKEFLEGWIRGRFPKGSTCLDVGACELCGKKDQDLRILFIDDFAGWACAECIEELRDCVPRRFCAAGEETEPGE